MPLYTKQILAVIAIILWSSIADAKIIDLRAYGPLFTRTQHPLYLGLLAMPIESAVTLTKGQRQTQFQLTFSNMFERRTVGDVRPDIDMEIWRWALSHAYGFTDRLDLKVEMPFLTTTAGFLDPFIQWYHGLLNAPNGGRQRVPDNRFRYFMSKSGVTLFDYPSYPFGPGDISLRLKYLALEKVFDWPVKVGVAPYLKLPTGMSSRGLGSGHADLGGSVFIDTYLKRFHLVTQGGIILTTGHDSLRPLLRRAFMQFGQSAEFQIMDGWGVIAQVTGSTSAFKNVDTQLLSAPAIDMNIGFAGSFPIKHDWWDEWYYQFSFAEDVTARGPAVDFSIMMLAGVRY